MTFCYQRKLRMLFNTPFTRLTPISPYQGNITKEDLDMRRKAEILKYNSQVGKPTKTQKYSQTVRGNNPSQKTIRTNNNNADCDSIYKLSTSSDVPGPPIYLYLNKDIPLYNYSGQERTYSILPQVAGNIIHFYRAIQTYPISSKIKIGTLEVVQTISESLNFKMIIPYSFPNTADVVQAKLYITCDGTIENISTEENPISLSGSNMQFTCVSKMYSKEATFYEFFLVATDAILTIDFANVSFTSS